MKKSYKESLKGANVVCLIPARCDTKVWHNLIFPNAMAICYIKGRLKFGGCNNAAPFPSALVMFGRHEGVNLEDLKQFGALTKTV